MLSALGLCALAYTPFAEAFNKASSRDGDADDARSPRPRYRRVVFLDLRHHGDSKADSSSPNALSWTKESLWETLSADLRAATRSLGFSSPPDVLAHSLGAGVAALACASAPELFGSLFLFEPPLYPLVAAADGGVGERDLAGDNASFAAAAAAASALSFGSRDDASAVLEIAPPFKWWHPSCRRAFVEHGLKRGGGEEGGEKSEELVFSCGGRALAALASGLLTSRSASGGPSRETYRALGRQRGDRAVVISYSAEPRSDVTAFLRAGAVAAAEAAAAGAAPEAGEASPSSSCSSPSSSDPAGVVVLPVRLPEGAKGERSGHYAPLVSPEQLGQVAAAAMMAKEASKEGGSRSRF